MQETPPDEAYEPVDTIPDGVRWRPCPVHKKRPKGTTVMYSLFGATYKLVRDRETGAVQHFKLKDTGPPASSKEAIDAEPVRGEQVRYKTGARCWFIEANRWFLVEVVERKDNGHGEKRIVVKPTAEMDADRLTPWAYGPLLELVANPRNMARFRPLRDRHQ